MVAPYRRIIGRRNREAKSGARSSGYRFGSSGSSRSIGRRNREAKSWGEILGARKYTGKDPSRKHAKDYTREAPT